MLFDDAKTQVSSEREPHILSDGEEQLCNEILRSSSLEDNEMSIDNWKGD